MSKTRAGEGHGIRVIIVDDHPLFRDGLAAILSRHPGLEVVGEAGDGAAAAELFRAQKPDVALMDLCMPTMGGAEATRLILDEFPCARIIILAADQGEGDVRYALEAGARGYLLKSAPDAEVAQAVRTVHQEGWVLPRAFAEHPGTAVPRARLTACEVEVLGLMARGFRDREIARMVSTSDAEVRAHVRQVFEKLGARERTEAVVAAIQRGILRLE